jgi:hypothetical protein
MLSLAAVDLLVTSASSSVPSSSELASLFNGDRGRLGSGFDVFGVAFEVLVVATGSTVVSILVSTCTGCNCGDLSSLGVAGACRRTSSSSISLSLLSTLGIRLGAWSFDAFALLAPLLVIV